MEYAGWNGRTDHPNANSSPPRSGSPYSEEYSSSLSDEIAPEYLDLLASRKIRPCEDSDCRHYDEEGPYRTCCQLVADEHREVHRCGTKCGCNGSIAYTDSVGSAHSGYESPVRPSSQSSREGRSSSEERDVQARALQALRERLEESSDDDQRYLEDVSANNSLSDSEDGSDDGRAAGRVDPTWYGGDERGERVGYRGYAYEGSGGGYGGERSGSPDYGF